MNRILTLTTDFGYKDPYVGVLKGVILSICIDCTLVDLTHGITPHSILEGNFSIRGSYPFFPKGTLHLMVVDPGVGGQRRILYLENGGHAFLAPDNGLLTGLISEASLIRSVENKSLFMQDVSHTFHGRDIFAPVAAKLLTGMSPENLGPVVDNPVTIEWSEPTFTGATIEGSIIYIDVYGNLVTNITRNHINRLKGNRKTVYLCGKEIGEPQPSYSIRSKGSPLAILGSFDHLEVAVNEGNAAQLYNVGTGDEVIVTC